MGIPETFIFYACVGSVAAVALTLATDETALRAAGLFVPRAVLWPFFVPGLFGGALTQGAQSDAPADELAGLESQLVQALQRLDGVAEEVLAPEVNRVRSLVSELERMRRRTAEMHALLESGEFDAGSVEASLADLPSGDERRASLESRLRSIHRLERMHERARLEYEKVVLQLEELRSKILLLRFADDPEDKIVSLMRDISSSVEGVCAGAFDSL